MTEQKKKDSLTGYIVLFIVLVLIAALGSYYFMDRPQMDVVPVPAASQDTGTEVSENAPMEETMVDEQVNNTEASSAVIENTQTGGQTASAIVDMEKALAPRALGNPDAPVKIIEYASLTCSHCAHFHNEVLPALKEKYIDTGKVYFEFREFPLNDPALKGTLVARCLPEEQYHNFVSLLFKTQDQWAGGLDYMKALRQNAKLAGMTDELFDACMNSADLKMAIANSMQDAQDKWKINSTPTFIVNDGAETISGAQPLTEFERVFRKVTGDTVGDAPAVE